MRLLLCTHGGENKNTRKKKKNGERTYWGKNNCFPHDNSTAAIHTSPTDLFRRKHTAAAANDDKCQTDARVHSRARQDRNSQHPTTTAAAMDAADGRRSIVVVSRSFFRILWGGVKWSNRHRIQDLFIRPVRSAASSSVPAERRESETYFYMDFRRRRAPPSCPARRRFCFDGGGFFVSFSRLYYI